MLFVWSRGAVRCVMGTSIHFGLWLSFISEAIFLACSPVLMFHINLLFGTTSELNGGFRCRMTEFDWVLAQEYES